MTSRRTAGTLASVALLLVALATFRSANTTMAAPVPASLTGQVTSRAEGAMEGVVLVARRQGAAVLTSVTTDAAGRFRFPRNRVDAGTYSITIRAAGYVLERNGVATVEIGAATPATLDLRLEPATTDQLAHQLTSVDWWTSMPGTAAQKDLLVRKIVNCGFCHDMEPITRSRYTAEQFLSVIRRMNTYAPDNSSACGVGSTVSCEMRPPGRFQVSSTPAPLEELSYWGADAGELANYLASINLSGGKTTWDYPLKAMPRPSGRTSDAVVTVYPIPRQPSLIHDLDADSQGNVWYGDSGWGYLGKLDPKTVTFTEYPAPQRRSARAGRAPVLGVQDVQVDTDDNVWAVVGGSTMAYFDTKAEQWHEFNMPASAWAFTTPFYDGHSETVWTTGRVSTQDMPGPLQAFRLNFKKGVVDAAFPIMVDMSGNDFSGPRVLDVYGLEEPLLPFCYQIDRDPSDNFICADFYGSNIITVDATTGSTQVHPTPTPHAGPRRGHADGQGRFWFAEFLADRVAVFDSKTASITEFPFSTKYMSAYAAAPDEHGHVWASSTGSDRVVRIDPRTGETTEYLMPVYYDARKVEVDPSTTTTTVWLPNKNLAQLIRIEVPE